MNEGEMVYGKTLRTERKKIGITQTELGRMIGKSKQWVSEFERGNIRLNMDIAVQLINSGLGTPCAWIPASYEYTNELSVFGIVKDAPAKYENNGIGYISFNIEGLV